MQICNRWSLILNSFTRWVCSAMALGCGLLPVAQAAADAAAPTPMPLSLPAWVQRVQRGNAEWQAARLQSAISATAVARAQAAFQPQVRLSLSNAYDAQANTYEEQLSRSDASDYWKRSLDGNASVSALLATGASLEANASLSRFDSNINQLQPSRPAGARDNRALWSLSFTQPLARDGGVEVTEARARVAQLEADGASRQQQRIGDTTLANALVLYFDLHLAQAKSATAERKLRTAQALLEQAQALSVKGLLAPADLWDVRNAVSRFEAERASAQQGNWEVSNKLKTLVSQSTREDRTLWQATDTLPMVQVVHRDQEDQVVDDALNHRADLQALRLAIEREQVQLMYARNQDLARLDLVLRYGRNKLSWSAQEALGGLQTPSWSLGLEMQAPLGPNQQGQADIAAAQARLEQAQWQARAVQAQVVNEISTALSLKQSAAMRYAQWQDIVEREQQAVALEEKRLNLGRTSVRDLLNRQEHLIDAQQSLIEQQVAYAQADVLLQAAQGTLAQRWQSQAP